MEYTKNQLVIEAIASPTQFKQFKQTVNHQIKSNLHHKPSINVARYVYSEDNERYVLDVDVICYIGDANFELTHSVIYYDEFEDKAKGLSEAVKASDEIAQRLLDELNAYEWSSSVTITKASEPVELPS